MSEAKLKVNDAHGRRVVPLDKPLFTIGRRGVADLKLGSADVSREHAEIAWDGDQYVLRDVGSSHGTFVNGQRINTHTLTHGDRIRLGQNEAVELVFEADATSMSGLMDTTSEFTSPGQMAAILNGLRALGSGRVLGEVLALVLDGALDVTKAERGFIMLANELGELEFKKDGRLSYCNAGQEPPLVVDRHGLTCRQKQRGVRGRETLRASLV